MDIHGKCIVRPCDAVSPDSLVPQFLYGRIPTLTNRPASAGRPALSTIFTCLQSAGVEQRQICLQIEPLSCLPGGWAYWKSACRTKTCSPTTPAASALERKSLLLELQWESEPEQGEGLRIFYAGLPLSARSSLMYSVRKPRASMANRSMLPSRPRLQL